MRRIDVVHERLDAAVHAGGPAFGAAEDAPIVRTTAALTHLRQVLDTGMALRQEQPPVADATCRRVDGLVN